MKLIIQIPCFNEEDSLPITMKDLPSSIEGVDHIEYLIVDDGSTDKTVNVAEELGIHHIVKLKANKGLAFAFKLGIDTALRLGADIIVNTDADNQYNGHDIDKLIKPIIDGKSDIVIGERPIDSIEHFSWLKKKLQRLGSWAVRIASNTDIPDAPSGFRAYSREAAMQINVLSEYTYTLETIIQAGRRKMVIQSVPITTNSKLRESRLFSSMLGYLRKSVLTILRIFILYKPFRFFSFASGILIFGGVVLGLRFFYHFLLGEGDQYIKSLIFLGTLMVLGVQMAIVAFMGDLIAGSRKISEETLYRVKKLEYDGTFNKDIYFN